MNTICEEINHNHNSSGHNISDDMVLDEPTHQQQTDDDSMGMKYEVALMTDIRSNEKFLLSCAPAMSRLSNQKNALARLKIQKLLYDLEFEKKF